MTRRGFLASLLGLAAAPLAVLLPAKATLPVATQLHTGKYPWSTAKGLNDAWIVRKYWYDTCALSIRFRDIDKAEYYKPPRGTSS